MIWWMLLLGEHFCFFESVFRTSIGDSDLNGVFDSNDLVQAFTSNLYEQGRHDDAKWSNGDWNCDGRIDSNDIITAFQRGHFSS